MAEVQFQSQFVNPYPFTVNDTLPTLLLGNFPEQDFEPDYTVAMMAGPVPPNNPPIPEAAPEYFGPAIDNFEMPEVELPFSLYGSLSIFPTLPVLPPDPLPTASAEPVIARAAEQLDPRVRRLTEVVSEIFNSLKGQGFMYRPAFKQWMIAGNPLVANRDPLPTDDVTNGATTGTPWVRQDTNQIWFCVDASEGAAVWNGPY